MTTVKYVLSSTFVNYLLAGRVADHTGVREVDSHGLAKCYREILTFEGLMALSKFVNTALALGINTSYWCSADHTSRGWTEFFSPFADTIGATSVAGVEWWVRRRPVKESMAFHFDKDEHTFRRFGAVNTPWRSTVFYLSQTGGPTVITNQKIDKLQGVSPTPPTQIVAVSCEINQLLSFPGELSHAVVGLNRDGMRTTFIMNWWDQVPLGLGQTPEFIDFPNIELDMLKCRTPSAFEGDLFVV